MGSVVVVDGMSSLAMGAEVLVRAGGFPASGGGVVVVVTVSPRPQEIIGRGGLKGQCLA